ncbi:hypothetical protein N7539_008882 [Penicillium diatomitis]|uniref:Uncharacterized protein n=1 Tax=Penicillium diatomitis TaxID=2819901 RepID=A0A9W9WKN1_9EURO|nr:uncharacterized protein N7539_008882 [Penicillium diatomitis]KAJ5469264.1 hypothetical protein N7539_008882 [Penicillium diatomitis]
MQQDSQPRRWWYRTTDGTAWSSLALFHHQSIAHTPSFDSGCSKRVETSANGSYHEVMLPPGKDVVEMWYFETKKHIHVCGMLLQWWISTAPPATNVD